MFYVVRTDQSSGYGTIGHTRIPPRIDSDDQQSSTGNVCSRSISPKAQPERLTLYQPIPL